MKSVLGFFSALALGLFAATVVAMSLKSPIVHKSIGGEVSGWMNLDFASLLLGLALGLGLATLARVGWADLPRRLANWIVANTRNFAVLGFGVVCAAVIVLL